MKGTISLFAVILAVTIPSVSFGQVAPIASGSTVDLQYSAAKQMGNNPIEFETKGVQTLALKVSDDGIREYIKPTGVVNHAFDKTYANIAFQGKVIAPQFRFSRFPQGKPTQPGMTWKVPAWKYDVGCGPTDVNYTATTKVGPEFSIVIDGTNRMVKTIRIDYEAMMPGCASSTWRMTHEELFSPELDELLSSKTIRWSALNPTLYLGGNGGSGWTITAIKTPEAR